jgi:hypothetical protein
MDLQVEVRSTNRVTGDANHGIEREIGLILTFGTSIVNRNERCEMLAWQCPLLGSPTSCTTTQG